MSEWKPIESAPYETVVRVEVGEMTFLAALAEAASEGEDGPCDQWQAAREGEHPPCWTGGACWESNENEAMSLQPTRWQNVNRGE